VPTEYFISFDAHCRTTDVCVKTRLGKLVKREHLNTAIPPLRELIESLPHPRYLALEESAIANWLYRHLQASTDQTVVCNPRRNHYIAQDGDKDDPIDAEKLNDLFRGGYLKSVHQKDTAEQAGTKQVIGLYHDRVHRRLAEGLQLLSLGKRWGLLLRRSELDGADAAKELPLCFKAAGAPASVQQAVEDLLGGYQQFQAQEARLYQELCDLAKASKVMRRVMDLPGYGPVRAATLICYLDTPWRFRSKSALWKYVGIGLKRERSGDGPEYLHVEQACNRLLRNMVIGAAQNAIEQKDNIFLRRYRKWIQAGCSFRNARRNVAREQVAAIWGMWKSDTAFDERLLAEPEAK
jgi:transposase